MPFPWSALLGRYRWFLRRRRPSLVPPPDPDESEIDDPAAQSQVAKLACIADTQAGCFQFLEFCDYKEFSYLLPFALEHGRTLFTEEEPTASLLARLGPQMTQAELREVVLHSKFVDSAGFLTSGAVERALTAASPAAALGFSWDQQHSIPYVNRMLREDFTLLGRLSSSVLSRQPNAMAIAAAHPFALGWMLSPAKPILGKELLGRDPAAGECIGFHTVRLESVHPAGLMEALRAWLLTPGCVRRLDDSLRAAFERDRARLPAPSERSVALFDAFARRFVDPRVVRAVLEHVWADTSYVTGGVGAIKTMLCVSPNLRALSVAPGILQRIVANAVRLCTHVRAVAEVFRLEEAQRTGSTIHLVRMLHAPEVELVPGKPGAPPAPTALLVPRRAAFLKEYGGRLMICGYNTTFAWKRWFLSPYTSTAPLSPDGEHGALNVTDGLHLPSRLQLNGLGMFLSPETERMLPRPHGAPMSREDHEWLERLVRTMPDFGQLILDSMVEARAAQRVHPADAAALRFPGHFVLRGTPEDPDATLAVRCDSPAALAADHAAAGGGFQRLYAFHGAPHATFMGIVATTISFPDFEPELQENAWWSPMLHELLCRLQDEHTALVTTRHHRALAAVLRAWANRLALAHPAAGGAPPRLVPLFPGRPPLAYPPTAGRTARAMLLQAAQASLGTPFKRQAEPILAAMPPERGATLLNRILAECQGLAQAFDPPRKEEPPPAELSPRQRLMLDALERAQARRPAPAGGPLFWSRFLSDAADHLNPPGAARVYMPVVQSRQVSLFAWPSALRP
jgi:hypothetical protein